MMSFIEKKYVTVLAGLTVGLLFCGGAWQAYQWHVRSKNAHALVLFAQSIDELQKAFQADPAQLSQALLDAENAFAAAYKAEPGSSLAPFALAYQAVALQQQGKEAEAVELLEKALGLMSRTSPLYYAYALKLALLKIDATDITVQLAGRSALEKYASDMHNPLRDMALYYAGYDAWVRGDKPVYEKYWTILLHDMDPKSVWVEKVRSKVQFLA